MSQGSALKQYPSLNNKGFIPWDALQQQLTSTTNKEGRLFTNKEALSFMSLFQGIFSREGALAVHQYFASLRQRNLTLPQHNRILEDDVSDAVKTFHRCTIAFGKAQESSNAIVGAEVDRKVRYIEFHHHYVQLFETTDLSELRTALKLKPSKGVGIRDLIHKAMVQNALGDQASNPDAYARVSHEIKRTKKLGKKWNIIASAFGSGVLMLVPARFSDSTYVLPPSTYELNQLTESMV